MRLETGRRRERRGFRRLAMSWVIYLGIGVLAAGLSAVTLAERKKAPCTVCGKGEVKISRDFVYRCTACKAEFMKRGERLERRES